MVQGEAGVLAVEVEVFAWPQKVRLGARVEKLCMGGLFHCSGKQSTLTALSALTFLEAELHPDGVVAGHEGVDLPGPHLHGPKHVLQGWLERGDPKPRSN